MSDFLELEESELFDVQVDNDDPLPTKPTPTDVYDNVDDSDDDHSSDLVLPEFDDDEPTPITEDNAIGISVAGTSIGRSSAQPIEVALRAAELGTSTGANSNLGSLKTFERAGSLRPWNSESDLGVAASLPASHAHFATIGTHQATAAEPAYLGTSMPIRIPFMHPRGLSGTSPASIEGRSRFIPPHLLEVHPSEAGTAGASSLGLSPSAVERREKLMARNAILRSTGFIEVQNFAAPVVGEVYDSVKDSVMGPVAGGAPSAARPIGMQRRPTATSSLTAMLGSSR